MTPGLLAIGETMAALSAPQVGPLRRARSLDLRIAGAESTVAIGAARLGVRAAWIGRVGDDEFGALIRETLAGQGVDVSGVVVDPDAPTGLMFKERRASGTTRVSYRRADGAGARLAPSDIDVGAVRAAAAVHVSGITPALSTSAREAVRLAVGEARAAGTLVSLDLNHRSSLWQGRDPAAEYRWLVERADIVFATEAEAQLLVPGRTPVELARALSEMGPASVLLKCGADGATAVVDGVVLDAPVFRVRETDPVGAGDSFAAGWLADTLAGAEPAQRLRTAAAAGAFAVTVDGDWEGLPSRAELHLLEGHDIHR
ncbi:2-dehydro-3-deoxygluconokinase [Geodermatophilus telluris]|uniref:2-dehydro-3-deoxygluconokinase n=1 Tax=Geodermatophilus telluris TaxID=1190417 RepID=A0A1G6SYS8_9ACTN|nr:sugar kinase [Geodermatophilus telluris]SDD21958.1 2-dehydro-3-deoxygluconokinase [Geodermatophilus telluris]